MIRAVAGPIGEEIRASTELVTPESEHVLDWFHITMRVTVLEQNARGVAHHDETAGERLLNSPESIKSLLSHDNQHRSQRKIGFFEEDVDGLELNYPHLGKFVRAAQEFAVYVIRDAGSLTSYGERFRTCYRKPEPARSMARFGRSSNAGIRASSTTTSRPPLMPLQPDAPHTS